MYLSWSPFWKKKDWCLRESTTTRMPDFEQTLYYVNNANSEICPFLHKAAHMQLIVSAPYNVSVFHHLHVSPCAPTSPIPALLLFFSYKVIFHVLWEVYFCYNNRTPAQRKNSSPFFCYRLGIWQLAGFTSCQGKEIEAMCQVPSSRNSSSISTAVSRSWLRNTESAVSCATINQGNALRLRITYLGKQLFKMSNRHFLTGLTGMISQWCPLKLVK